MPTAYVFKYKFHRAVYYIINAKHFSKAWRATLPALRRWDIRNPSAEIPDYNL